MEFLATDDKCVIMPSREGWELEMKKDQKLSKEHHGKDKDAHLDALEGGEYGGHTKGAAKKKKNQNDDSSNSDDFDEDAFVELEKHW